AGDLVDVVGRFGEDGAAAERDDPRSGSNPVQGVNQLVYGTAQADPQVDAVWQVALQVPGARFSQLLQEEVAAHDRGGDHDRIVQPPLLHQALLQLVRPGFGIDDGDADDLF